MTNTKGTQIARWRRIVFLRSPKSESEVELTLLETSPAPPKPGAGIAQRVPQKIKKDGEVVPQRPVGKRASVGTSTFVQITSASAMRQLQLGLRFTF